MGTGSKRKAAELARKKATKSLKTRTKEDEDNESLDPNDPEYQVELEEPEEDLEEDEAVMQTLTAPQRAALQRKLASINNKQKDLKEEVAVATARASAQKQLENNDTIKAIDIVVKTFLWRTCKFLTCEEDLDAATGFVFSKMINDLQATDWSKQQIANWKLTYRGWVSKKLCSRRNYVQQELRKAAIAWGKGMGDIDADDEATTDENPDDNEEEEGEGGADTDALAILVPRDLFTLEMITKCATR